MVILVVNILCCVFTSFSFCFIIFEVFLMKIEVYRLVISTDTRLDEDVFYCVGLSRLSYFFIIEASNSKVL